MIAAIGPLVAVFLDDPEDMAEIFERPEFDRSPGWWERFTDSVGSFFRSLSFSWLGPVGQFLMWLLLIAAVAALVWWIARQWKAGRFRRRRKRTDDDIEIVPIDIDAITDPGQLAASRDAFETARDYKQAVLVSYRLLVVALMDRGVVSREPGRTTGELRAEVQATRPQVASSFGAATELFEVVWFSDHGCSHDELDRIDRWSAETLRGLGVGVESTVGAMPGAPA